MEPLASLSKKLKQRRLVALQKGFEKIPTPLMRDIGTLAQLDLLIETNQKFSPHPIEEPLIPFDRLLLWKSRNYRKARQRAWELGARFVPEIVSLARSLSDFAVDRAEIRVSPVWQELKSLAQDWNSITENRLRLFHSLRHFHGVIFHELNHFILFRSIELSLKAPRQIDIERYFSLIESFVILLDYELAEELGETGCCLFHSGLLYRLHEGPGGPRKPLSFKNFRFQLLYSFLELEEIEPKVLGRKYKKNIGTAPDFVSQVHRDWLKRYFEAYGPNLKSPMPDMTKVQVGFGRGKLSPENVEGIEDLYGLYLDLFHS